MMDADVGFEKAELAQAQVEVKAITLSLVRFSKSAEGIFSHLLDAEKNIIAVTAEHAYGTPATAKIPNGTYTCVRGTHVLHSSSTPFQTFEVTGVEGHSGLLFHPGNYPQVDSAGCILTGTAMEGNAITESRKAFARFMELLEGLDQFTLVVC